MKKIMFVIAVLILSVAAFAQHFETTLKIVGGKARIVIKAVGGPITGSPTGATFVVRIPAANASATITSPSSPAQGPVSAAGPGILDAAHLPTTIQTANFTDANFKYFIFLIVNGNASQTFADQQEFALIELVWGGPAQSFPVSLASYANGNLGGGNTTLEGQWINYLENNGNQYSFGDQLFYASANTNAPTQMAADYSSGTASVTTNVSVLTVLPVHFLNFSGYKNGTKNTLLWTTTSEENNRGFEVQRSNDGINYSAIGFINTQALGGISNADLNYTFNDMNPVGRRQYYRLRQEDIDGRSKLSNIVTIAGDKPKMLSIGGLYPNPASSLVNVIIDAPSRDKLTLVVSDINGKMVKQQLVNVDIGSNTIPVEISNLAQGSYMVKLLCQSSDCETAAGKFNKQ
jgi:hypothetical protein